MKQSKIYSNIYLDRFLQNILPKLIEIADLNLEFKCIDCLKKTNNDKDKIQLENHINVQLDPKYNFLKIICYLFMYVPFSYLAHKKFLPQKLEYLFNQLEFPNLSAELLLSLSINLTYHFDHYDTQMIINEPKFTHDLYKTSIEKTIYIRNDTIRIELKKPYHIIVIQ